MRLIVVTRYADGKKMHVNPEQVCAVYPYYKQEDKTVVQFHGTYLEVIESADSVASMMEGD